VSRLETLRRALEGEIGAALADLEGELHQKPRLATAAIPLCLDPKVRIERSIYRAVEIARGQCRRESERRHSRRLAELRRILRETDVVTRYQPIVELRTGGIHGIEALSAAPSGEFFASAEILFTFAEDRDLSVELERMCRREATRRAVALLSHDGRAAGGRLFVNCSAHSFADPQLVGDLAHGALGAGLDPNDLVIEVTERVAITEWQPFHKALGEMRRAGLKVAVDDMGSGYSSLHAVGEIQPDYLKFDFSLIHGIHRSSIKRDLLETLLVLAGKIGARSIAEGIETVEELETVREMGVDFGQGFLLAPPAPAEEIGRVHFPVAAGPQQLSL
jgi:EAL domain-containing protein (putative c-di-GMP-specific phosphodiesterase class I)